MADSCPIDVGLGKWIDLGRELTRDFQAKTREKPEYALLTASLHKNVEFNHAQKFVNKLAELNSRELRDRDKVFSVLAPEGLGCTYRKLNSKGKVTQYKTTGRCNYYNQATDTVTKGMNRFVGVCGEDGKLCLGEPNRSMLKPELSEKKPKIGFADKTADLALEYLGDDSAVCVDRHVMRYACLMGVAKEHPELGNICDQPLEKIEYPHKKKDYQNVRAFLQKKAINCRLKPIDVQVAAWLKHACEGKSKPDEIVLDEDHRYSCRLRETGVSGEPITAWM